MSGTNDKNAGKQALFRELMVVLGVDARLSENWGTRIRTERKTALVTPPDGFGTHQGTTDSDLKIVVDAWSALPEMVRRIIVAMVNDQVHRSGQHRA